MTFKLNEQAQEEKQPVQNVNLLNLQSKAQKKVEIEEQPSDVKPQERAPIEAYNRFKELQKEYGQKFKY